MPESKNNEFDRSVIVSQLQAGQNVPAELVEIFTEEAEEHLRIMYAGLNQLKSDPADLAALGKVRRSAHTLKGAAGAVGLESATRLSHRMEDLLDRLAETETGPNSPQIHLFLSTCDLLQELTTGQFEIASTASQIGKLYRLYSDELHIGEQQTGELTDSGTADNSEVPSLERNSESATPAQESEQASVNQPKPDRRAKERSDDGRRQSLRRNEDRSRYLRVPVQQLDDLVGIVGEMLINRSAMQQCLQSLDTQVDTILQTVQRTSSSSHELQRSFNLETAALAAHSSSGDGRPGSFGQFDSLEFDQYTDFHLLAQILSEGNSDIEIVTQELSSLRNAMESLLRRQKHLNRVAQNSLMQIRMVPLSSIVSRLERTVRTVSGKLDKSITLVVSGDHTELDKTVLDEIVDPLQHLFRNAIDHGVENAVERKAAGKPEHSKILLTAINQGTQVTLAITDDGHGINKQKVRQKAIESGLIQASDQLNDDELYGLIFRPGFSTAATLTDVSGRGVGMDVVSDAISRLNGTIRVHSEPGVGTTFTIQLPTTVGVTQAVLVQSVDRTFAIPMQSVSRIIALNMDDVEQVAEGQLMLNYEGRKIQLRELAGHLNLPPATNAPIPNSAPPILLVTVGDDEIALLVESIIGARDIVVKNLGEHLKNFPGIIGATVQGDGSIIPILEPTSLINKGAAITRPKGAPLPSENIRVSMAMVVDDSISVRRVTSNLLQKAGWDVMTACDGVDALKKLEAMENTPDVFLCDMEMPRMDGIELIKRLRRNNEFKTTPIITVTSRGSEKHRKMAFAAGATEYVVKPYHEDHLIELIDDLVQVARETI